MALCRYRIVEDGEERVSWGWIVAGEVYPLPEQAVIETLSHPGLRGLEALGERATGTTPIPLALLQHALTATPATPAMGGLLAPVLSTQEIWAAGVTYESSKLARMAESEQGGDLYARVYVADRPELFFKATPGRVVGPGGAVRIRSDSHWNVPEPELAALIAADGRILGYTIGNDMSSRDIEGANALYLPQAKLYRAGCGLGPIVVPAGQVSPQQLPIRLQITRQEQVVFAGETSTASMRRTVEEIVPWLMRENDFPHGVYLLTGTGIVPSESFTLYSGDRIDITIEPIGTLSNIVA
jgi:2-dehydro-3-deoxy-D-arabinonate dehydratase